MDTLAKNSDIELEITALSHEGEGIGRYDGMAVFVPMSAVGDRLLVRIVKVLKNRAYGIIKEILSPSHSRIENDCPVFKWCGGCALRHISYEEELRLKWELVRDNLRRIGGFEIEPEAILPSPDSERYRNKAQYPVRLVDGRVTTGFFARRSHRLIPVPDCKLQPEFFAELCRVLCDFIEEYGISPYNEECHTGLVRHLYLRYGETTGELMVCLVLNGKSLPHHDILLERFLKVYPKLTTFVLNHNTDATNVITGSRQTVLFGAGTITDELCGVKIELSPFSFYQVNRKAAERLYKKASEYAAPKQGDILLDLYCGAGAIGLSMAHLAGEIIGVEVVPEAVENADANAVRNGIGNARFIRADAGQAVTELANKGVRPDIILLDPPRKGADTRTLEAIDELAPERIVYISCNSATLARDCAILAEKGYRLEKACPADLFPRTPHVECVALMSRLTGI